MPALRVLLLEDTEDDELLMRRELKRLGYEAELERVETAEGMRAALARTAWDLVLSDWSMPQFSARAGLSILKSSNLDLPFIIVSGTVGEETAVAAMRAGAHDFVVKDKLARLGAVIERELRESELRRAGRRATEALQLQENRFRSLIERSTDGITLTSRDGVLTYVSPAAARMFGFDADTLLDTPFVDLLHEDDRPQIVANMRAIRDRPHQTQKHEIRARRGDGSICWIEARTTNLLDVPGVAAIVGNLRDITEERRMRQDLRVIEERYRQIVETTGEAVWIVDAAGIVTFVNARMGSMLDREPETLLGKSLSEVLGGEIAAHVVAGAQPSASSHRQLDAAISRRDGGELRCLIETSAMRDVRGTYQGTLGMMIDVTARHRAEQRFARLAESGLVGIAFMDLGGRIDDANDTFLGLLGYSRSELTSGLVRWPMNDDNAHARPFERELPRKDGSCLCVLCGLATIDANQLVVFVADLTAQKRAEAALRNSEDQLRHAQKMESMGRLAGGIAHDFNNILTIILGQSEMLAEEPGLSETVRQDVEEIRQAGLRAAGLTNQLLMFSRQQVVEPTALEVDGVLSGMTRMIPRVVGEDVDLKLVPGARGANIRADRGQIEQVILNLVINARDAMPRGGRLTIATSCVEVSAAEAAEKVGATPGPHVQISVSDTGTGIAPETLAVIFEPFFTTKERGKGTGLGLSTVFGIVEASRGTISVDTALGAGSTFRVRFPQVEEAPIAERIHRQPTSLRGTETVLLVEDEEQVRAVTAMILKRNGYNVLMAARPSEALRIAVEHAGPIDLLLTDVVMPELSGPELAAKVREIRTTIRTICMSGYIHDTMTRDGVAELPFLQKPIRPDPLLRKLRDVIESA